MIPELDILLDEQTKLVDRLKRETEVLNSAASQVHEMEEDEDASTPASATLQASTRRVESIVFKGQIHGWLQRQFILSSFLLRFPTDISGSPCWGSGREEENGSLQGCR